MNVVPIERILLATAASVFPAGDDASVPFSDTGTSVASIEDRLYERVSESMAVNASLLFDFDNGWFSKKMLIPGSDAFISFKRKPSAKMNVSQTVLIPDWGVSIPIGNAAPEAIRNAVVRQYVMLADKARKNMLSGEERGFWKRLLADSDYGDFCQRTAPAVKDVGKRVRTVKDGVEVVWSSGESEKVEGGLAAPLAIVEDGEEFSARVKFIDCRIASLSEVVPLGKPAPVDPGDLFGAV